MHHSHPHAQHFTDPHTAAAADATPSRTHHTAHRYDDLIKQVSQVQQELQLARVVIQQLRDDNNAMKANWSVCQQQLIDTRHKYNKKKEELLHATQRVIKTEKKHEAFRYAVWVVVRFVGGGGGRVCVCACVLRARSNDGCAHHSCHRHARAHAHTGSR